jgi:P-type Cu+ transporter
VAAALDRKLALDKVECFESGTGIGERGSVNGEALVRGNITLMSQTKVAVDALKP